MRAHILKIAVFAVVLLGAFLLFSGEAIPVLHPLSIESLRKTSFPGSDLLIERKLKPGVNYERYIASYQSEGLKIYGLLTVPTGKAPETGWPAIIFNHGYIPPKEYRTTERYVAYTDAISRRGYVLFRPDYRGHGNSEGNAESGYASNAYTIDVLNALTSLKKLDYVDSNRIGMWGHSMGGYITLRSMVTDPSIKAGVIWGGVVASHIDLMTKWKPRAVSASRSATSTKRWRELFELGTPEANALLASISANSYLSDVSGPIELHHGTNDESVPHEFSKNLYEELRGLGKEANYFEYNGDNHNISKNWSVAMARSVAFFDKHVKNAPAIMIQ